MTNETNQKQQVPCRVSQKFASPEAQIGPGPLVTHLFLFFPGVAWQPTMCSCPAMGATQPSATLAMLCAFNPMAWGSLCSQVRPFPPPLPTMIIASSLYYALAMCLLYFLNGNQRCEHFRSTRMLQPYSSPRL